MAQFENFQPPTGGDSNAGMPLAGADYTSWQAAAALEAYRQPSAWPGRTSDGPDGGAGGESSLFRQSTAFNSGSRTEAPSFLDMGDPFSGVLSGDGDQPSAGPDQGEGGDSGGGSDRSHPGDHGDRHNHRTRDVQNDRETTRDALQEAAYLADKTAAAVATGDPLGAPNLNVATSDLQAAFLKVSGDGHQRAAERIAAAMSLVTDVRAAQQLAEARAGSDDPSGSARSSNLGMPGYHLPDLFLL